MCLFEILRPASSSRTQDLKGMKICSLSPVGRGLGWLSSQLISQMPSSTQQKNADAISAVGV
ncbi:hypothetical protein ABH912_003813 [Pseudomonas sp. BT76 TE3572]